MSWASFLPNFLATVVGAVLGIPTGLYVAGRIRRFEEREQRETDELRRGEALKLVRAAVVYNIGKLAGLELAVSKSTITFEPLLNTATWDMERDDIRKLVLEPEFRHLVAIHFDRVARVERLARALTDYSAGVSSAVRPIGHPMGTPTPMTVHLTTALGQTSVEARLAGSGVLQWTQESSDGSIILRRPEPA